MIVRSKVQFTRYSLHSQLNVGLILLGVNECEFYMLSRTVFIPEFAEFARIWVLFMMNISYIFLDSLLLWNCTLLQYCLNGNDGIRCTCVLNTRIHYFVWDVLLHVRTRIQLGFDYIKRGMWGQCQKFWKLFVFSFTGVLLNNGTMQSWNCYSRIKTGFCMNYENVS